MFARILVLLAPVASLGCGINNNCGPLNPFGCAKDSGANMFGEDGSSAGETSEAPTTTGSTSTSTSGETSTGEPSDTTEPVDPTTSEATTTSSDVSTTSMESTTTTDSTDTTSSTGDGTSTGETTMPGPVCGDGNVDGGEECDDGNDDAKSCDENCHIVKRRVFVTSATFLGALGGLSGADHECQVLADTAQIDATFMAWLSTGDESPSTRFPDAEFTGQYVKVDGVVVAEGWTGLISGLLMSPINKDEKNALADGKAVWTNTKADGMPLSDADCMGWELGADPSATGLSSAMDGKWTNNQSNQLCSGSKRLYCIEVP